MKVSEIYASLLGESTHTGRPAVLVRFTGCSLRCRYCDTAYAFHGGEERSPGEIADRVRSYGVELVLLTGGEPLEQEDLPRLIEILLDRGHEVIVETGGHRPIGAIDARVVKILDIKCPGSGHADDMIWSNIDALGPRDEVKFVIADRTDYEWAKEVLAARLRGREGTVLLSAAHGRLLPAALAEWILEDGLRVRLQVQLHRILWPDRDRGV
ncbi:MAG: radical SAM protein [Candidatus Eisenbacteria bacterium]